MSIWKRIAERMRSLAGSAERTPSEGGRGMSYPDAGDRARKEAMMSGEGFIAGAGTGEFPASRTGADEPVRGSENET